MTPTTRASAEGKLFKKGIARGSAKASSGKDMSSGMASEISPWLVAPPNTSDAASTAPENQNTRSLKLAPVCVIKF